MTQVEPPDVPPRADGGVGHFECELYSSGRAAAWVLARGELDLCSASRLAQMLAQALAAMRLVVVDLRQLTFMDSSGVHVIVEADVRARRAGRRLVLIRGPAQIDRLFELLGLSERLEIIDLRAVLATAHMSDAPAPNAA